MPSASPVIAPVASSRPHWLGALGWWLLAVAIVVVRKQDAVLHPQLWAEDAVVFHLEGQLHGWRALLAPYAGYYHTLPRLITMAAQGFDPAWTPAIFNYASLGILMAVFATFVSARLPVPQLGGAMAVAVALTPQATEVLVNLTNLQWVTALFLVVVGLSAPPRTVAGRVAEIIGVLLVGLTGPFSVAFAPLFWARLVWRRDPRWWAVTLAITLAAGLQLVGILHAPPNPPDRVAQESALLHVAGLRLFAQTFSPFLNDQWPAAAFIACAVAGFAGCTWLAVMPGPNRAARCWLFGAFVILLFAVYVRMGIVRDRLLPLPNGKRYFFDPRVVMFWLILHAAWDRRRAWFVGAGVALAGAAAVTLSFDFPEPAWKDLRWRDYCEAMRAGQPTDIPINPEPWIYQFPGRRR